MTVIVHLYCSVWKARIVSTNLWEFRILACKTTARYTTFHHVYKDRWRDILRFRARSLFTTCEVCCAFKTQLQDRSLSFEQKLGCLQGYRSHLHDQYCDRTVIWTLLSEGCDPQSRILMICTDGLDQAKFALPRDPLLRTNAGLTLAHWFVYFGFSYPNEPIIPIWSPRKWWPWSLLFLNPFGCLGNLRSKHQRPRLKIHGVWAYGYVVNISVMDESSRHDSSAIIEMVSQTIEDESWFMFLWTLFLKPTFWLVCQPTSMPCHPTNFCG